MGDVNFCTQLCTMEGLILYLLLGVNRRITAALSEALAFSNMLSFQQLTWNKQIFIKHVNI